MTTEEKGRQMIFHGEVTGWEPHKHSRVFLAGDFFDIDVENLLKAYCESSGQDQ